jgi:hypothetical protein
MYLEDFADRLRKADDCISPALSNLLMDLARELLTSRPKSAEVAAAEGFGGQSGNGLFPGLVADFEMREAGRELDGLVARAAARIADAGGEP